VQNMEIPNLSLADLNVEQFAGQSVLTADHCFACTAGCGSSCGGELV